jgi:predicted SAM-dependent methyltransferase
MFKKQFTQFVKPFYYTCLRLILAGNKVECPICGIKLRKFKKQRPSLKGHYCPKCFSLERHRLIGLFLRDRTDFFNGVNKTVLHVAPAPCFKRRFSRIPALKYVISDLGSEKQQEHIDITDVRFPDYSIDVILCNHVLEHISDDRKAMRELLRVLKGDGWAILNVPADITRESTYENPSITAQHDRLVHFGQEDHVRIYGRDYPQRLKDAGFIVKEVDYIRELGKEAEDRYVLMNDDRIYFCTKR